MAELLLELFSEEIPARMQSPMAQEIKERLEGQLNDEKLYFSGLKTYATPRRITAVVDGLSLTQEDVVTEKRGPRVDAPQPAIEGFLKSSGLKSVDQLTRKNTEKGEFFFAISEQKGRPTKDVLQDVVGDIVSAVTWPKSMRWGDYSSRWVRPLQNICCVFGGETLKVKFGHLEANDKSFGHRFLGGGKFNVENFSQYKSQLEKGYVVLDAEKRKERITMQAEALAAEHGLEIMYDDALLEEVAGLVEYPEVILGSIDEEYMHVPDEVLVSSIRTHQKYFCLKKKNDSLSPFFLVVANMVGKSASTKQEVEDNIRTGNERVLRARLADAAFFWEQDRKKPLKEHGKKLDKMVFHAKLGTVADKTKRIEELAKLIAVWVPHANLNVVGDAAKLAKADLSTEMVGEFPDLQGIMGRYYAKHEGLSDEIADAIMEHYSPKGAEDSCPTNPVSITIALADKVDTLAGMFAVNEKPTGSKDPFALRRAALGVIRVILENRLAIPMRVLFENALREYPKSFFKKIEEEDNEQSKKGLIAKLLTGNNKKEETVNALMGFFNERLKHLLKAENIRYDLIDAVFGSGQEDEILRAVQRVAALGNFLKTDDGENLLAAYNRANNIVVKEEKKDKVLYRDSIDKGLLEQVEEENLYDIIENLKPVITKAIEESRFEDAMSKLAELRAPVDAFFDNVTVNAEEPNIRANRLNLLAQIGYLLDEIADF